MTGGFATIAGTVLAAFINFGIKADLLIAASVMAAPTALAVSKLFYPELEKSKTTIDEIKLEKGQEANILDAASQGASRGSLGAQISTKNLSKNAENQCPRAPPGAPHHPPPIP